MTIRDIINSAFGDTQLVGEGQQVNGTKQLLALTMLNELVYAYNLSNYLNFTFTTLMINSPKNVNVISLDSTLNPDVLAPVPMTVTKCLYSNASQFIPIYQTSYPDLQKYTFNTSGLPSVFAYQRNDSKSGVLLFDIAPMRPIKIIYKKLLPAYKLNDTIDCPEEYQQLFRYGLAVKLGRHYGCESTQIQDMQDQLTSIINLIMENNKNDTMVTYDDNGGQGNYFDILCPRSW